MKLNVSKRGTTVCNLSHGYVNSLTSHMSVTCHSAEVAFQVLPHAAREARLSWHVLETTDPLAVLAMRVNNHD